MYNKPFHIVSANIGSKFAKTLQQALKEAVPNKVFRRRFPKQGRSYVQVTLAPLNKIEQFQKFTEHEVSCPPWTTSADGVATLGTKTIFARQLIASTNGRGIVEFELGDMVPPAPLYTGYIPKKAEFRVHVFKEKVIDVQQKKKCKAFDGQRNTRIRNSHNGYVYCRDGIVTPVGLASLAIKAVKALDYSYGAVDIIYNENQNRLYVLEVNSRPGLMGTTLNNYVSAIKEHHQLGG
jgi:hypothetical protein